MSAVRNAPAADLAAESANARKKGHLRFDRRFGALGVSRLQRSSGTSDVQEFDALNRLLSTLAADETYGGIIVRAFAAECLEVDHLRDAEKPRRRKDIAELGERRLAERTHAKALVVVPAPESAVAEGPPPVVVTPEEPRDILAYILGPRPSDLDLIRRPLWETARNLIVQMTVEDTTKRRYATSIRALRDKASGLGMPESSYEILADLSEEDWATLNALRTRGLTTGQLAELSTMPTAVCAQRLRRERVRIGAGLVERLGGLTRAQWDALTAAGDRPVGPRTYEALDRLTMDKRERLRTAVRHLHAETTVADLVRMTPDDWKTISLAWGGSGADWNHVRRSLAAVLTDLFHDDARHPVRRHVIDAIPTLPEVERVPDLPPEKVWRILEHLTPHARQFPLLLVATGLRIGEYERLESHHLLHDSHQILVPGTKTASSEDYVQVMSDVWPDVVAAVPAPFRYCWLRRTFRAACADAGVDGVTLHDLRHCHAQWAMQGGALEHEVQSQLRHKSIAMTRRYAKTVKRGNAATASTSYFLAARPST